ncbi:dynamin family protein [Paenibacillus sp. M1]|uniref:Dynamin family protein n=1 Tax=Paenibacillus haidiansis TaxID=1574488 RepID=A0ABU7VKI2_9BACL
METITTEPGPETALPERLNRLEEWYTHQGDPDARAKVRDLRGKWFSGKLTLSFCGHFSAGKSSLINMLCGKPVLPSGPVPTTANVAALHNGPPQALLVPAQAEKGSGVIDGKLPLKVELGRLDEYCRDGEAYEMVSIWDDIPLLGERGVLLDTPGVDSGEAGHALATNSALHLADIVFYVMDYNHVLSESNLSFARRLADWGKPLYLVVNQIDKHREEEVEFRSYRESVEQAFALWGIENAGVFYISLKDEHHRLNMLPLLKRTIQSLLERPGELLEYSIACSLRHGGEEFLKRKEAAEEEERERLLSEAGGEAGMDAIREQQSSLEAKLEETAGAAERVRREWLAELDRLLGSAYLMTPALREAAGHYLESLQPGFKTGLLFGRGKRERERERRAELFLAQLKEQVSAQLDWHIRDLLRGLGRSHELWNPAWESRMDEALPQAEEAWISGPAREGAVLSGEYTLRYTADVAAGITGRYRRSALALADGLLAELAPRLAAAREDLAAQREALLARSSAAARLAALRAAAQERASQLHALLGAPPSLPPGLLPEVRDVPGLPPASRRQQTPPAHAAGAPEATAAPQPRAAAVPPAAAEGRRRLTAAAAALEAAAETLAPYPAFGSGVRDLRARAARLRGGTFTVALFGAFSAGKSSFANALLGARVLPVSPHPTTAAISRILAPGDGMKHGEAVIGFKTREAMIGDLAHSFTALQLGPWKERSWRSEVEKLKATDVPPSGRAHYSFLKAAAAGWEDNAARLGTRATAGLDEFSAYAAEESKACFVESMDLYYSCPVTEQGIVLVDTPGADSIHARHTGVTFQYMKNCDALLYVTYYNHAFSRADRQFLAHLGRVKGSFTLDKMFFIVNASDLAASEAELASVVEHVTQGLRGAGIERPQIYALSSQNAQTAQAAGDEERLAASGFPAFEAVFFDFIGKESAGLAVESAGRELQTAIGRARDWGHALTQSREEREEQLEVIRMERHSFAEMLQSLSAADKSPQIIQETEELLFHVRTRLRLLAGDLYHEFFHPALLREEGGDLKRKFAASFQGWLSQLSVELERELQATSLRLEKRCDAIIAAEYTAWIEKVKAELRVFPAFPQSSAPLTWVTPDFGEGALEQRLNASDYAGYFRNPKAFFEAGGKQKLRAVLEQPLEQTLKEAVEEAGRGLADYYSSETSRRFTAIAARVEAEWLEWETGFAELAAVPGEESEWNKVMERLTELASAMTQEP